MKRMLTANADYALINPDNAGQAYMAAHDFPRLDALDIRLMSELESDAKQTHKDLALKLGVNRVTVASMIQRLSDKGVIKNICWVDPLAMGYEFMMHIWIYAHPGQVNSVAERMAASSRILQIDLFTGRFNIGAYVLLPKREDFADFLTNELGSIDGILQIETIGDLRIIKTTTKLLAEEKEPLYLANPTHDMDSLDIELIRALLSNPQQKASQLAKAFGLNEKTIFLRIQKLTKEHVIRITTVINPLAVGYTGFASIGLKCEPVRILEVANAVASYKQVQYVSICAGQYDITLMVLYRNTGDLYKFITTELAQIPGLKDIDTRISCKPVKTFDRIPI